MEVINTIGLHVSSPQTKRNNNNNNNETEGFAIAIQDQVINTKNYLKHVIKDNSVIDDKCRCKNQQETTEHITSGCSLLAPTEYTHSHDNICKQLHLAICKKHQLTEITDPWYKYKPQTIIEND
jgi:hypothetical protein